MTLTYLDGNGWIQLYQVWQALWCEPTAEHSPGVGLQLLQHLLLLSWQQRPCQGLLQQVLENAGLACFTGAAQAVIPQQL